MTEENTVSTDPRESLSLKLVEPEVSSDSPWGDDVLNRAEIAARLTNLIRTQSVPFVVSIDGYWGTGKTFMLKRWRRDLEKKGFQSIYFNAWEDDFCDDPLLAIIGQLSIHLNNKSRFKAKAREVVQKAKTLFRPRALSVSMGYEGYTVTGNVDLVQNQDEEVGLLEDYLFQRESKDNLKKELSDLAADVAKETKHPLVFIIDELDRCRPTFAIELLERVKHIFDVPNLVFVFGINRDELCKSLQSLYGEIEADVYLRRFFDMEFTLPESDPQEFCRHLFERFEFAEFFAKFSADANSNQHLEDYKQFSDRLPELWSYFGFSLRDIDYCVRLIALASKNVRAGSPMYPWLLGLLIALKFNNQHLYKGITRGEALASDVMNYVHSLIPKDSGYTKLARTLALMEGALYVIEQESFNSRTTIGGQSQFMALLNEKKTLDELPRPEYLSERIKEAFRLKEEGVFNQNEVYLHSNVAEARTIASLLETIVYAQNSGISSNSLKNIAQMIDLHQEMLRR